MFLKCFAMDANGITLLVVLHMLLLQESVCDIYRSRQIINDILFNGYKKQVRPRCPANHSVSVVLDLAIRQIMELNEPEQTLKTNVWLRVYWNDCRLTWNQTETGISSLTLTPESVWTPDLTLYDSCDDKFISSSRHYRIKVTSEGELRHQIPVVMTSVCAVDTTYFPFDRQSCPLKFGMWSHSGLEINITNLNTFGDMSSYIEHVQWQLSRIDVVREEPVFRGVPFPTVQYVLVMKRKPLYFVINLLFPCILITFVSVFAFLLPSGNGDKINLEVTVLLALAVCFLLVRDMMPPNSESVPYISIYFAATLVLVGLSCVINVIILNLYSKGDHGWSVPRFIKSLFIHSLGEVVCIKTSDKEGDKSTEEDVTDRVICQRKRSSIEDTQQTNNAGNETREASVLLSYFSNINERLISIVTNLSNPDSGENDDWKLMARILDRIFMVFHILFSVLMLVILIVEFLAQ